MTIVYAAPFSKAFKLHSTEMMEKDQIAKFKYYSGCLNVAPGGEGASAGSPHFLYVVSIEEAIGPGRVLVQMVMGEMIRCGKQRNHL